MNRREAMGWMGIGAAAALLPGRTFAQEPAFPNGAIIRTLFKDSAPGELAVTSTSLTSGRTIE